MGPSTELSWTLGEYHGGPRERMCKTNIHVYTAGKIYMHATLTKLKLLYDSAINSDPDLNILPELLEHIELEYLVQLKFNYNSEAIEKLKKM